MTVLVTGGGGFLGSWVVRKLLERGDDVRIIARSEYPELAAQGVDCRQGDIADADAVLEAVRGCDVVHHVAGQPGVWGDKQLYWRPNVTGTENVIEACRTAGVGRLVYTSSPSAVFGDEPHDGSNEDLPYPARYLCHYPESKAAAERLVLRAHVPGKLHTVSLRPHLIWGPGDRYLIPRVIEAARAGSVARVGDGKNKVSVVYVENAAAAHLSAADAIEAEDSPAGGKPYFIAQAEPVLLWEFIDGILDGVGAPRIEKRVSYKTARFVGGVLEAVYKIFGLSGEPRMTRFVAAQLGTSHWYSIDRARRDLGYDPKITTDEGLKRLFADYAATAI